MPRRVWRFDGRKRGKRGRIVDGHDYELVAQHVSRLSEKVAAIEERVVEAEKVNARLEAAALTMSRALAEIARHWDAVYEAMRREEETALGEDLSEGRRRERMDFDPRESA
jgi:hypothetical protein